MELDFVDRAILDNMQGSVGVSELADRTGFARTTVLMHLHRLERLGIVVHKKVFTGRRGRPRLLYKLKRPHPSITATANPILIEFKKLRHLCRFEKGRWCKKIKKKCTPKNCPFPIR
ncbi:TPA: ArsR family transcriptional regulator [Candidatus Bathyarchaeota archaeon]|nr:ArsR family transcriptional regulator [Candidatus Bathyarchaeota archaeon]